MINKKLKTNQLILCGMFSALIAVGAFIKIPVPVVPFTLQVLFTTLAGLLLGGKLGALSALIYMLLGLSGVPVFTEGGGLSYLLKPTFGYIIGFVLGAYVTGTIANKVDNPSFKRVLIASLSGLMIIYICGMIYYFGISHLYLGTNIGLWSLFLYCFLLVIPGDLVLCVLCSFLAVRLIPILKRRR